MRHVQGDPGAQRIAEEGARLVADLSPYRLGHEARCRRQVGPHRSRIAVAGQIHRDQGVRRGQQVPEAAPEASRLREAVQEDQRRPGTAHLDMEWHDRVSVQATFSATLVDEWVRLGVTDAVVCAGSRSTPLALPLADRLRVHVRLDERSGAFFALGLAMATGRPTIICVTSGTAAAELHPAVVEAHHARVPLIVCTADRPPELHDTGAPAVHRAERAVRRGRPLGPRAGRRGRGPGGHMETPRGQGVRGGGARGRRAGPVHLNLEFREPLIGTAAALPARQGPKVVVGGRGRVRAPIELEPLRGRGMIIAGGPWSQRADPAGVAGLADTLGWPVLADPLSGSRLDGAIAAADAIVRTEPPLPECIVLLGTPWLSRALGTYVSQLPAPAHGSSSSIRCGSGPIRSGWRPSSISVTSTSGSTPPSPPRRRPIRSGSTPGGSARSGRSTTQN